MKKRNEKVYQALRLCIAENLARLRAERGLTFEALGERSGLHLRHLQKIEAGESNPTVNTIALLAAALEVDPKELVTKRRAR